MTGNRSLIWSPYSFLGQRPFREARIRAYIRRQHRHGRQIGEILGDREIERLGGRNLAWHALLEPDTIPGLKADILEAIEACRPPQRPR